MSDFASYMQAQTERKLAYAEYNGASIKLELAQVRERAAELRSQHEPLNSLTGGDREMRDKINAAVFYVLHGRMPS